MTSAVLLLAWALADPPPGDAYRLPPLRVISSGRVFNYQYRNRLRWRLEYERDRDGALHAALEEAQHLYEVWDAAEGAHPDWNASPGTRAGYLRKLRVLLGPDAYRRMELPPCVPTWRFNEEGR
jgi:hypothetical protein